MFTRKILNETFFAILILFLLQIQGCKNPEHSELNLSDSHSVSTNNESLINSEILIPNPTESMDFFPCSDCHAEMELNTQRRELVEMHDDIEFDHDSENRWCLACHDAINRDSLRLASGKLLSFEKSYLLCGQCHGPKIRDWKLGIHGKRTGEWNGEKQYLLCVHCHDPHSPKFNLLKPLPPPIKPGDYKLDSIN
jgi:uncharacterized CHY-type Zn-finger protein